MTNNPARSIFFAGYLSYYVFSLCFLSKTYLSFFVSIRSYVSAKVEILLWIYPLSRSLDINFSFCLQKIFLDDASSVFRILYFFSFFFISPYMIKHITLWLKPDNVLLFLPFCSLLIL